MSTHFDYGDGDIEYKFRALIYPNITLQSDFSKDSYYIIMSKILKELTKIRSDTFFTVLTLRKLDELNKNCGFLNFCL